MITIPSILSFQNVAVFGDDEDCNLYYLLSTTPKVRILENGSPAFNGLFWTDKADGTSNSTAGLAGGYINFDVNLSVSEEQKDKIKNQLEQADVQEKRRRTILKQERERLARLAKVQGTAAGEPDVPKLGEIHFGSIHFKEGIVTLLQEADGKVVEWSSAGATASLIGDNNAAFAMRLGADGAAIWYKALMEDAIGIGVRYELLMPIRLPSLEIHAYAGSHQKLEMSRKAERVWKNVDNGCSDADVERINVSEIRQQLTEESLVYVEVKKGSSDISDEHVSQLRNMMMSLIDEKVKEIIKSRVHGMTEEERKNSVIELIEEEVNSFVELRYTQKDVVDWKVAPQSTITQFLEDVPKNKRAFTVDLSDPIVSTIEIPVHVDAPWDEEPFVNAVKVICEYPSADKEKSFLFNKNSNSDIWRFRRPEKDDGIIKYTAEVYFKGISEPYVMPMESTNGAVNIQVGKIGMINLIFKPHPVLASLSGDNQVISIEADISYKSEEDADHFVESRIFTPAQMEGSKLEKFLGKPIDAPVEYTIKYNLKNHKVIEVPKRKYYISERDRGEIYSPSPFEDMLELPIELGITPNDSLKKIIVEFNYEDTINNFESQEKVELSEEDDWDSAMAKIVQMDKDQQDFKWKYKILSEDNVSRSEWIQASGDQTIVLPILPVLIDVSRLGLGDDYTAAIIDLHYEEAENDFEVNDQLFLMDSDRQRRVTWYIPRMSPSYDEFTYALTLYKRDGEVEEYRDLKGKGRFLIVMKPSD